jgi:hypothetical protein
VPDPVARALVQFVHVRSVRLQPPSAHVTLIAVGSKLGDVQLAYISMLLSTLVAEPDGAEDAGATGATGVGAGDAAALGVGDAAAVGVGGGVSDTGAVTARHVPTDRMPSAQSSGFPPPPPILLSSYRVYSSLLLNPQSVRSGYLPRA